MFRIGRVEAIVMCLGRDLRSGVPYVEFRIALLMKELRLLHDGRPFAFALSCVLYTSNRYPCINSKSHFCICKDCS